LIKIIYLPTVISNYGIIEYIYEKKNNFLLNSELKNIGGKCPHRKDIGEELSAIHKIYPGENL